VFAPPPAEQPGQAAPGANGKRHLGQRHAEDLADQPEVERHRHADEQAVDEAMSFRLNYRVEMRGEALYSAATAPAPGSASGPEQPWWRRIGRSRGPNNAAAIGPPS
jgi:hypothetical protein